MITRNGPLVWGPKAQSCHFVDPRPRTSATTFGDSHTNQQLIFLPSCRETGSNNVLAYDSYITDNGNLTKYVLVDS